MKHQNILSVLRQVAETGPPVTDAELLGRFARDRDPDAFAMLVQRHGRLVWAVCQHLAGSNAEDAFQATFLVLLRNAGKIRHATSLAAWLHGVAYRVCSKARQSSQRRLGRERTAAVQERANAIVADSAWDRALSAVHEEVGRLPENLRVPFVLCILEGRSGSEAAKQLGWKSSTLSMRLTRAKEALIARLDARGLSVAAAVAVACSAEPAPAATLAKAACWGRGGVVIPGSIHYLTQGVIGMSANQVKMLAAGVLLTLGLGVGGGARWMSTAEAQPIGSTPAVLSPEEKVKQLEAQLEQARREVEKKHRLDELKAYQEALAAKITASSTEKWRYQFVPVSEMDAEQFVKLLGEREAKGWEYNGQTTLKKDGQNIAMWTFRQPTGALPAPPIKSKNDIVPKPGSPDGSSNRFDLDLPPPARPSGIRP